MKTLNWNLLIKRKGQSGATISKWAILRNAFYILSKFILVLSFLKFLFLPPLPHISWLFIHFWTQTSVWICHKGATGSEAASGTWWSFSQVWMIEAHHGRVLRSSDTGMRIGVHVRQIPCSGYSWQHPFSYISGTIFKWAIMKPGNVFSKKKEKPSVEKWRNVLPI